MKKLLFTLLVSAAVLSIQNADARYRYYEGRCGGGRCGSGKVGYDQCPPPPCCERQELITVRKPAEMVCGFVCPDGTTEVEWD